MAIGDQIGESLRAHQGMARREALGHAVALLRQVGIPDPALRARSYPHEPVGRHAPALMIAAALVGEPKLLLADEPTTALDVTVQAQILQLLKELQRELGLSMIFITHDLSVLVEVSDRLAIMYAGRIVEEGPANQVFHDPKHPYTTALAAAFPEIGDTRFRGKPSGLGGDPPDPSHVPSGCSFHPRCPVAFEECPTTDPALYDAGRGPTCCMPTRHGRNCASGRDPRGAALSSIVTNAAAAPEAGGAPLLEVRDLHVSFAGRVGVFEGLLGRKSVTSRAVDGVSFQLRKGEVMALAGESGCGKTTTARAIMGWWSRTKVRSSSKGNHWAGV